MIESLDIDKCVCCGTCEEVCPMDVFRIDWDNEHSTIKYRDDCQTCYTCELECPESAIKVDPYRKPRVQAW